MASRQSTSPGSADVQKARVEKFAETLQRLIDHRGYRRSRKIVWGGIGKSASALSQYEQNSTKPGFDTLVKLANFFEVSLDYLVFGVESASAHAVNYDPFLRHMDIVLARQSAKIDEQSVMVARIAQKLLREVAEAARVVADKGRMRAGLLLTDEETMILEQYSLRSWIASMNMQYDVIKVNEEEPAAAGRFLAIVAANLDGGCRYRFLLPARLRSWRSIANEYATLLRTQCQTNHGYANCEIRTTDLAMVNGFGLYELKSQDLERDHPALYEMVRDSVSDDGWIGYTIPPSEKPQADTLMDLFHLKHARETFETAWKTATVLLGARVRRPRRARASSRR